MADNPFDPKRYNGLLGAFGAGLVPQPDNALSSAFALAGLAKSTVGVSPYAGAVSDLLPYLSPTNPFDPPVGVSALLQPRAGVGGAASDLLRSPKSPLDTLSGLSAGVAGPFGAAASDLFGYAPPASARQAAASGIMRIRIWDVEHGACAMLQHVTTGLGGEVGGRLAMIDSGDSKIWSPSSYIRRDLNRNLLDYLFITNADQDHMSDLRGLAQAGVNVDTLIRNPSYNGHTMRAIKLGGGPLTNDAEWYVAACDSFSTPTTRPFNQCMNGITCEVFYNSFPRFIDTNNLSLVAFIRFGGVTFLFPGDLEREGWLALLERPDFRARLGGVDILVASHHGRENGFCKEVFNYCRPQAVVISDKPIVHDTQRMTPDYRAVVRDTGVIVRTTGRRRHVLTTRRDGWIVFDVDSLGKFFIDTEYHG
jgi:hypothetical protein